MTVFGFHASHEQIHPRELLAGEEVSHDGLVTVDRAKLWTRPEQPPALIGAAVSVATARWCAEWADGLITVNAPVDHLRQMTDAYREAALSSYRHVLASRLPVYTVADMRDPGGRIVHYERLLLPFGQNGIEVDRILASLETVSPEGAFENRGLMNAPPRPHAFALCTTIQV